MTTLFEQAGFFDPDVHRYNSIHPTAIIGDGVIMGRNNYVGPYCVIEDGVTIGNDNRFEGQCSIGTSPEHRDYWHEKHAGVRIGDNCMFREFVTVNAGTLKDTVIEDNVIMLRGSHVGHDSFIGHHTTLSCNALVGGESHVFPWVIFGLGAVCHQRSVIGACSIIGMGGVVTKKSTIIPGRKYAGNPVIKIGVNVIAMDKAEASGMDLTNINNEYSAAYNRVNAIL